MITHDRDLIGNDRRSRSNIPNSDCYASSHQFALCKGCNVGMNEQHQFILPYMLPYSISFTTVLEPYPMYAWLGTAQKLDHVNYIW